MVSFNGIPNLLLSTLTLSGGITFSPDGKRAYVTDTGIALGFYGRNLSSPASVYSFDVNKDGTWENRKTFAYVPSFIPDGESTLYSLQGISSAKGLTYLKRCPHRLQGPRLLGLR